MRTIFFCVITCLIGLSIGLMINVGVVGDALFSATPVQGNLTISTQQKHTQAKNTPPYAASKAGTLELPGTQSEHNQAALLRRAYEVLSTLKAQDFPALAKLVHPEKGLTLTPYSTVNPGSDLVLSSNELAKAKDTNTTRIWGLWNDSGSPITLTIVDYFQQFVYNADYISAPMLGVNTIFSSGNSLENVAEAYPDAKFIEFYFPGLDPNNNGFDWCGLKLVFEPVSEDYRLVGIVHSEWTT